MYSHFSGSINRALYNVLNLSLYNQFSSFSRNLSLSTFCYSSSAIDNHLQAFSSHSLNKSDPIKGTPLPLSYCLSVFSCGLVFWLLVLLWPKLCYTSGVASVHSRDGDKDPPQKDIGEVATLVTAITTINLCGCLELPIRKLPLLVHFLVLFQLSGNLALLLIWASLSVRKYIIPSSTLFTTKTGGYLQANIVKG